MKGISISDKKMINGYDQLDGDVGQRRVIASRADVFPREQNLEPAQGYGDSAHNLYGHGLVDALVIPRTEKCTVIVILRC